MSGICGIIQNSILPPDYSSSIQKMQAWNSPYGKSSSETHISECFSMTCHHDKLTNSPTPNKLILHQDSKYAVIDAVIYNRDEIIENYSLPDTYSDEELIFSCINQYGIHTLRDINGDFAGAIYDKGNQTLTLFRDHMGIRPLFYYADDKTVVFSSDIRGLVAMPFIDLSPNENWFYHNICGFALIDTDHTEFANIHCIPPAEYFIFTLNNNTAITKQKYWELGQTKISLPQDIDYINKMRDLVTDSVKRRLAVIPGTIGAELSGGLDSGVIDILINRLGREGLYFSWSVDPDLHPLVENDERSVILDICSQENITCHFPDTNGYLLQDTNAAKNIMQIQNIDISDGFQFSHFAFPPYINTISILTTAEYIKHHGSHVVFCGHGGDEGVSHRCNPYELFYNHEYYHYFKQLYSTTQGKSMRLLRTLKACYKNLFITTKTLKTPASIPFSYPDLVKPEFHKKYKKKVTAITFAYDPKSYIKKGAYRNRTDIVALLGAFAGVRYIIPFLDFRLVDFAVSIPRHLFLNGKRNRFIFREAFKDIIPASLYDLKIKANNSKKTLPPDPNWYDKFAANKKNTYESLNKNLWQKYIDYDIVDEWARRGKPSTVEDTNRDTNILYCLSICLKYQNLIEQVRGKTTS